MTRLTVMLQCDGCFEAVRQGRVGESIESLRDRLSEVGWICSNTTNVDHCPACVKS